MARPAYPPRGQSHDPSQEPARRIFTAQNRPRRGPSPAVSPVQGLPAYIASRVASLSPDGKTVYIAGGSRIEQFELDRQDHAVIARRVADYKAPGIVQQLLVARNGDLFVLAHARDRQQRVESHLALVAGQELRSLRSFPARVTAAAVTRSYLVVLLPGGELSPPEILYLRRRDGRVLARETAESDQVRLAAGRNDELLISLPGRNRQRYVNVARRVEACQPPPTSPPPSSVPQPEPPPTTRPCSCGCHTHKPPPPSSVPGSRPVPRDPHDDCVPGDSGIPDGCIVTYPQEGGWAVSVNLCEPEEDPCQARLDWDIGRLQRTPNTLIASSRDGRRIAFLNPGDLRLLHEHRASQGSLTVVSAHESDAVLLVAGAGQVQLMDPAPVLPAIDLDLGIVSNTAVYQGQSAAVNWDHGGHALGVRNVLIIPVLEPGQFFQGTTAGYFSHPDFQFILETAKDYFHEASYFNPPTVEGLDVRFRIFGADTSEIYTGPPVAIPKPIRDYWGPAWDPGALLLGVVPTPLPASGVLSFSGDEQAALEAIPEVRDPRTFAVRFPAASFRVRIPESPPALDFGPLPAPARSFNIQGTDRQGDPFNISPSTTTLSGLETVDLQNSADFELLADILQEMLQGTGRPDLFDPPIVRREDDGNQLGLLHITLHFAPGPGDQEPRVTVFDANALLFEPDFSTGATSSLAASFNLPGDEALFAQYLVRILAAATVDHEDFDDIRDPYFELFEENYKPQVDTSGGNLRIRINLSSNDGRHPARISVDSHIGLEKIGMDFAISWEGVDVGFSGGGGPLISEDKEFFSDVYTAMIDAILAGWPGSEQEAIQAINRYFNCEGMGEDECASNLIHNFVVTPVHFTAAGGANKEPDISGLRPGTKPVTMEDLGTRAEPVLPVGWNRRKIATWMRISPVDDPATEPDESMRSLGDAFTLAHELGHGLLGLSDQYSGGGFREDIKYIGGRDLMGDSGSGAHLCAYHKRIKGWLADDASLVLDRPPDGDPIDTQVVLVQLEAWDPELNEDDLQAIAQALLPGTPADTPVKAAVFLRLGGDGRHFNILELRGKGPKFSPGLDPKRVVITNAVDYEDDTRYAREVDPEPGEDTVGTSIDAIKKYRRKIHLIDDSLRAPLDSFDFASEPTFPEVGLVVSVEEWNETFAGSFAIARLRIQWERMPAIDLGFPNSVPDWNSTEIAILKPDEIGEDGEFEFPENQDPEELETFLVPESQDEGPLDHKVLVRVSNFGDATALNVEVDLLFRRPAGGGDPPKTEENFLPTKTIDEVPPSSSADPVVIDFDWPVNFQLGELVAPDGHVCFRAQIGDRDVPRDESTGLALASDDTNIFHIWAQQNVFKFQAEADSPPKPVRFSFSVFNDGLLKEEVLVAPRGLGKGAQVTVTPRRMLIPRKSTGVFYVQVDLDERLLHQRCGKDISFVLEAWRLEEHNYERWGASKYTILPRFATQTLLEGGVLPDKLQLWGSVTPDVGALSVLLHVQAPGEPSIWEEVPLGPGSTFNFTLPGEVPPNTEIRATARFRGTLEHAASVSKTLHLQWSPPG